MGECAAPFCNNLSSKGYIMKAFPKDPQHRAVWVQNVGCENWLPTNNSCLCEVHFKPEMWKQGADHKQKLKQNAVPTTFDSFIKNKIQMQEMNAKSKILEKTQNEINSSTQSSSSASSCNEQNNDAGNKKYQIMNDKNVTDRNKAKQLENEMNVKTLFSFIVPSCDDLLFLSYLLFYLICLIIFCLYIH